jgi:hypothetical protein
MHEHCEQIYFEVVEGVQHYECHPYCVECPKIVVADTGHSNEAELAEWFIKQAVRNPNTSVSDHEDTHDKEHSAHEHNVSEVLEPRVLYEHLPLPDHLLQNAFH